MKSGTLNLNAKGKQQEGGGGCDVGNGVRLNKKDFYDLLYQFETYNKFYVKV